LGSATQDPERDRGGVPPTGFPCHARRTHRLPADDNRRDQPCPARTLHRDASGYNICARQARTRTDRDGYPDFAGNNAWSRNSYTEEVMPGLLDRFEQAGVSLARIKEAMASIGYERDALHELDRWESKRTTSKFGK